jgi:hypothetical protein
MLPSFRAAVRVFSSFASLQKKRMTKTASTSVVGARSLVVKGMISKIVFRAGGCTVAQLQMEEVDDPSAKSVTVQATNGVLNGQEVGDHVELRGTVKI